MSAYVLLLGLIYTRDIEVYFKFPQNFVADLLDFEDRFVMLVPFIGTIYLFPNG